MLKVSFRPSGVLQNIRTSVHRQSFTVEVCVIDKNDNVPTFIEESMRGSVQLGLLKGTRTLSTDVFNSIQVTFLVRCVQFNKKKRNGQSIKTDLSLEKEYGLQLLYVFNNFETRSFRFLRRKVELFYKLSQGLLVPLIWICQPKFYISSILKPFGVL